MFLKFILKIKELETIMAREISSKVIQYHQLLERLGKINTLPLWRLVVLNMLTLQLNWIVKMLQGVSHYR